MTRARQLSNAWLSVRRVSIFQYPSVLENKEMGRSAEIQTSSRPDFSCLGSCDARLCLVFTVHASFFADVT